MTHCTRTVLSACLLTLLLASALWAGATPARLNYQGLLTDANGQPLNAQGLPITFRIWAHPVSSDPADLKWEETLLVNVVDGLFSVILGDQLLIADSVFSTSERFLGIQIGDEPEGFPRTRLVSVGYSTRVETLDGARGGVISGAIGLEPAPGTKEGEDEELRYQIVDEALNVTYYANSEEVFTPCVLFADDNSRQCTAALNSGVAHGEGPAGITELGELPTILAQQSIECPADGFVLVLASCEAALDYVGEDLEGAAPTVIPTFTAAFGVSDSPSELPANQQKRWSIKEVEPFYRARNVISVQGLFSVAAGPATFYFLGTQIEGPEVFTSEQKSITLVFIPKAYGEVSATATIGATDPARGSGVSNRLAGLSTAASQTDTDSEITRLRGEIAEMRVLLQQALNGTAKP